MVIGSIRLVNRHVEGEVREREKSRMTLRFKPICPGGRWSRKKEQVQEKTALRTEMMSPVLNVLSLRCPLHIQLEMSMRAQT